MDDCFRLFDELAPLASQRFTERNVYRFYRTAAELQLAVNGFYSCGFSFDFHRRDQLEATEMLEKLRALKEYDVDNGMHVLLAEVDVNLLRGDAEQVELFNPTSDCNRQYQSYKKSLKG